MNYRARLSLQEHGASTRLQICIQLRFQLCETKTAAIFFQIINFILNSLKFHVQLRHDVWFLQALPANLLSIATMISDVSVKKAF